MKNKIQKIFYCLLFSVPCFLSSVFCDEIETFDFLRIPIAPRYSGMGRCNLGIIGDPLAVFINPVGIQNTGTQWASAYTHYISGIHAGCITKTSDFANGTLGVGINYWNFGSMDKYDNNGAFLNETFTPQCFIPTLAYSRNLKDLSLGASLKVIYQTIEDFTSVGIGTDIGFFIPVKKMSASGGKGLTLGGTIQNLGMQLTKFDETKEKLPVGIRIGGVYSFSEGRRFSVEMNFPEKALFLGLELWVSPSFTVRGGYYSLGSDVETGRALEFLGGLTLGVGFKVSNLLIDYALTPMAELGLVHQISLTFLPAPKKVEKTTGTGQTHIPPKE